MMLPNGLKWNEAELEPLHPINDLLISILAFDDDLGPHPIGTGFIVAALGELAVGCSAAHNFREIDRIQRPYRLHHPSALAEFLPDSQPLDLDRKRIRALHTSTGRVDLAVFGWVVWNEKTDIAFFLDTSVPPKDTEVVVLGYQDMAIENEFRNGPDHGSFQVRERLLMRGGRITDVHMDGFRLCKGPAVETSIPVFPGMSGGPVMRLGKAGEPMRPFGLISSDPYEGSTEKMDRSIGGSSIVSLIQTPFRLSDQDGKEKLLRLDGGFWAVNRDEMDDQA